MSDATETPTEGAALLLGEETAPADTADTKTNGEIKLADGQSEWMAHIKDPALRESPFLSRFKDIDALAKSNIEQQKVISKKLPTIPGDDATPEEVDAFEIKLGRPEKAEDYEVTLTRQDADGKDIPFDIPEAAVKEFKDIAHLAGVPNSKFNKVLAWAIENHVQAQGRAREQLKTELGKGYGEFENRVDAEFGRLPPELQELVIDVPIYTLSKLLAHVAEGKDEGLQNKATTPATKQYTAQECYDKKMAAMADGGHDYANPTRQKEAMKQFRHWQHEELTILGAENVKPS